MKLRQLSIVTVLVVMALGLASCGPSTGTGTVFAGGTNALLISFVQDTPPAMVYDGGAAPFDIMMRVKNDGDFDVSLINFQIQGLSTTEFSPLDTEYRFEDTIQGNTRLESEVIPGDEVYVPIATNIFYPANLRGAGEQRYTAYVEACYPYATIAMSQICIQRNYLDGDNTVCDPRAGGSISVSGAPLQITSFTQTPVGQNSLRVQYTFENRGNVQGIYIPKADQQCTPESRGARIQEENVFFVRVNHNGNANSISCIGFRTPSAEVGASPATVLAQTQNMLTASAIRVVPTGSSAAEGYLRLVDGKATLTCTLGMPSTSNAVASVDVMAAYFVKDTKSASFSVTYSGQTAAGGGAGVQQTQLPPSGNDPVLA